MDEVEKNQIEPTAEPVQLGRASLARLEKLARESAMLQGRSQALAQREDELTEKVGQSKGRLSLKAEIDQSLEVLQKMAHERSVGAFERMLTAISRDVQPGTATTINLELSTERSMPALAIKSEVAGKTEAITSGALANVVSTGLRFITLARSGRRRFMLLDEADCFIENGDTQNFFNVIHQLSRDSGIQTVLITHHDLSQFEDRFRIYRVNEVDSNDAWPRRTPELVSEGEMQPSELQSSHFTFVEAENFESYTRAHMQLSPGVTAIVGKNGKGKSSWARVLRGLLLGDSADENVRHGKPMMTTSLGFSDGRVLTHHRRVKGTPKGEYVLHSPDSYEYASANPTTWKKDEGAPQPLHHTETARLPEWVPQETGVSDVDGINVALWSQLTPVFMLDQPPSKRASLLSIGRESGHLFAMNELYKDDVKTDNVTIRDGEREIAALRILREALQDVPQLILTIDQAIAEHEQLELGAQDLAEQAHLIAQITQLQDQLYESQAYLRACEGFVSEPPEPERTEGLSVWFERLEAAQQALALKTDATSPQEPALSQEAAVSQWLGEWTLAEKMAAFAGAIPVAPMSAAVEETSILSGLLHDMAQAQADSARPPLEAVQAQPVLETYNLAQWLKNHDDAQMACKLSPLTAPSVAEVIATQAMLQMLEDIERTQSMVNGCRAQEENLRRDYQHIDQQIQQATQIIGAHWELPPDRIERVAENLGVAMIERFGEPQKMVCVIEHLHGSLQQVAKEGYAWGLNDGLGKKMNEAQDLAANAQAKPQV